MATVHESRVKGDRKSSGPMRTLLWLAKLYEGLKSLKTKAIYILLQHRGCDIADS